MLIPSLRPGDVVFMDNLNANKYCRTLAFIAQARAHVRTDQDLMAAITASLRAPTALNAHACLQRVAIVLAQTL